MFNLPFIDKILCALINNRKKLLFNDKINCILTPALFIFFTLIITTKEHIGSPINCILPSEFKSSGWDQYILNFCFMNNVYHIPINQSIPQNNSYRSDKSFSYYPWIPIILSLESLLFYLPFQLWLFCTNLTIIDYENTWLIGKNCKEYASCCNEKLKGQTFYNTTYFTFIYFSVKILYILNVVFQFTILSKLLGFNYFEWGFLFLFAQTDDPFPYVNFCDFHLCTLANIQIYSVQCFYSINLLNKIVFISLWIWLVILFALNLFCIASWLVMISPYYRIHLFKKYFRKSTARNFVSFISLDLYMLIIFISKTENFFVANDFILLLHELYIDESFIDDIV